MGGGEAVPSLFSPSEEEEDSLLLEQQGQSAGFQKFSSEQLLATDFRDVPTVKPEDSNVNIKDGTAFKKYVGVEHQIPSKALNMDNEKKTRVCSNILDGYNKSQCRVERLEEGKSEILRYRPGAWIENVGGMKKSDYDFSNTTTLLLVGPKGSGKSSLVNKISRVFEDDIFAADRAQVSYNYPPGDGTHFLQEYMIPRDSTSFCLYDSRSLSEDSSENMEMLKKWMTEGVRHGELAIRDSEISSLKIGLKYKARCSNCHSSKIRMVNYVIFVVNGLPILRSMEGDEEAKLYTEMVAESFKFPFLSFRDDKPVIVVTHGDLLSQPDRARVRLYLGEILGVPPTKQIFDIPENCDRLTELEVVDMLRYCLEHADRNLQEKEFFPSQVLTALSTCLLLFSFRCIKKKTCLLLLMVLWIAVIAALFGHVQHAHKHHGPSCNTDSAYIQHAHKHHCPPCNTPPDNTDSGDVLHAYKGHGPPDNTGSGDVQQAQKGHGLPDNTYSGHVQHAHKGHGPPDNTDSGDVQHDHKGHGPLYNTDSGDVQHDHKGHGPPDNSDSSDVQHGQMCHGPPDITDSGDVQHAHKGHGALDNTDSVQQAHKGHGPPANTDSGDVQHAHKGHDPPDKINSGHVQHAHKRHGPRGNTDSGHVQHGHKGHGPPDNTDSGHVQHAHKRHGPPNNIDIDWRSIRHLWLGTEYD